ncbi:MAG: PAS domain-containing protein [Bacilli bacterium]
MFNEKKTLSLGYNPKKIGEIGFEFFTNKLHPDDYERVMENMRNHLQGKTLAYEVEYRIRHKGGHYIWYYDRGTVVRRDEDGKPLIVAGTHIDITSQKEA